MNCEEEEVMTYHSHLDDTDKTWIIFILYTVTFDQSCKAYNEVVKCNGILLIDSIDWLIDQKEEIRTFEMYVGYNFNLKNKESNFQKIFSKIDFLVVWMNLPMFKG